MGSVTERRGHTRLAFGNSINPVSTDCVICVAGNHFFPEPSSLEQPFPTEGKWGNHLENSFSVKVKDCDSLGRIKREDGKTWVGSRYVSK